MSRRWRGVDIASLRRSRSLMDQPSSVQPRCPIRSRRFRRAPGRLAGICLSPDGSKIAYPSEREGGVAYVIPAIGGEPALIAPGGRNPRYSPDGRWIAYWVGRVPVSAPESDASGIVFVISASGGEPRRVGL